MKGIQKRGLALLLALALTASLAPAALAVLAEGEPAQDTQAEQTQEHLSGFAFQDDDETAPGGLSLADPGEGSGTTALDDGSDTITGTLTEGTGEVTEAALEPDEDRPAGSGADNEPAADDQVTFIVELEQPSLLAQGYSPEEIADGTTSVRSYEARQEAAVEELKAQILAAVGDGADVEFGYTYTMASTGLSVTTTYENKEQIADLPGVDRVYVAPMFHIPETDDQLYPQTSNATTMIGADTVNNTGYTGKGMRIAIIDTGLVLNHPSFQALSDDKLTEDSLTTSEVTSIWSALNASKGVTTSIVPSEVYRSTKVPFAFNYATSTLDVSHKTAGSDHGTHVAGIAAANRLTTTDVVGVAPDAQLLVMQVFSGSGASWDTVMAALEDCVRLKVDAVNLSLGAAGGFTDEDANLEAILEQLLGAGVQVVVAAGNDTNSAYNNNFGGYSLAENPDVGLVGTPSTYSAALSVASADNNMVEQLYFTVNGRDIGYNDSGVNNTLFSRYSGQSLSFVVLDGYGDDASYTGVDVSGKVVVVSRGGGVSFPDKQSIAQSHGAIACVVYNNTAGTINMQINTGSSDIPCVSISQADGQYLAGLKSDSMAVSDQPAKEFTSAASVSSFSSWGATPDLKLKPEITGVGGNIYSARDTSSNYGYMSGTSMASPQVAGAMAVLYQYLQECGYEKGEELYQVAANLLMSTADPLQYSTDLEYSPRQQGAGLVDLEGATKAGAYLSNPDAEYGRPKAEVGDSASGTYRFTFTITNISDEDKTYRFDSSLLTETYTDGLIGNQPHALQATVQVSASEGSGLRYDFNGDGAITTADARMLLRSLSDETVIPSTDSRRDYRDVDGDGTVNETDVAVMVRYCAGLPVDVNLLETISGTTADTFTVAANSSETLTATIALTASDRAYLSQFPNGMYVEGYLYVESASGNTAENLTMPLLGFYGDWSAAPVFDGVNELEGETSLFEPVIYTYYDYTLGTNPYVRSSQRTGGEYNAVSSANPMVEIDLGLLRNAKTLRFTVTDVNTGQTYFNYTTENNVKTYYSDTYGQVIPYYIYNSTLDENYVWNGKNASSGAQVEYRIDAYLDDGDKVADDSWSFRVMVDNEAPKILNADNLDAALNTTGGRAVLTLEIQDNAHVAAILVKTQSGAIVGRYEPGTEVVAGAAFKQEIDITGLGGDFTITVADYACNETDLEVHLENSDVENPTIKELNSGRLYANENVSDAALVDLGWFSVSKDTLSGARNETFSTDTYFSGEYVDGYVVAQRNSGEVVVLTPYGSYWSAQTIIPAAAAGEGAAGFQTLYDMALLYNDSSPDQLFAVGWTYNGNSSGNRGTNKLYEILFPTGENPHIREVAALTGMSESGEEMVCLTISDDGVFYGISTTGDLYTINSTTGVCTKLRRITEFTSLSGYSGVNVIQSMAYDHEKDVIYWAAHSQGANGYYTTHLCKILVINPHETGYPAEVIGSLGFTGASAMFIPTDQPSDLFGLSKLPTGLKITPSSVTLMGAGSTATLSVSWSPWNAEGTAVSWSSDNDKVATVSNCGVVTAVGEGTATITATATVYDTDGKEKTATATATVKVQSAATLYGFMATANGSSTQKWITYSTTSPVNTSTIKSDSHMWQGGAYYEGYVYTVEYPKNTQGLAGYVGTVVYKSEVTSTGSIGTPVELARTDNIEIGNLAMDYNTGRMYGVDLTNGGLVIVDTITGSIDPLGKFTFDRSVSSTESVMTAMAIICEGKDTTILLGSMNGNLWTVDPDTLKCSYVTSAGAEYWNYGAMTYDYNTGSIFWSPSSMSSTPLFLVELVKDSKGTITGAELTNLGYVGGSPGVEQTVMFSIPKNEPETTIIPVTGMWIEGDEQRAAVVGSTIRLEVGLNPARPTVRAVTWTSNDEQVAAVDSLGNVTFRQEGTATITGTLKDRNGQTFTDTVTFTVLKAGGNLAAFLGWDLVSSYFSFWITVPDSSPERSIYGERREDQYDLRAGEYYDGYFYAYTASGDFVQIVADNNAQYTKLGTSNGQVVRDMTFDYTKGTMYALTGDSRLMKVDLADGSLTEVGKVSPTVRTLAADKSGNLYAAGEGSNGSTTLYKLTLPGSGSSITATSIGTVPATVGQVTYNTRTYYSQMTYDYANSRFYLHSVNGGGADGLYLIQLGDDGQVTYTGNLGKIALLIAGSSTVGNAYLGMLCAIPEADDLPQADYVTGVTLSASTVRLIVGDDVTLTAQVQPSNTTGQGVTWSTDDSSVAKVENGKVTAVSAGTATITATSTKDSKFSATCTVTVLNKDEAGDTKAYALTAKGELISFNPKAPSGYESVSTISKLDNVVGMTVNGDDVYYLTAESSASWPTLYRYNVKTRQSTMLGTLGMNVLSYADVAYDPSTQTFYVGSGMYVYQYYMPSISAGAINFPSGSVKPEVTGHYAYGSMVGVTLMDGKVVALCISDGNTYMYQIDSFSSQTCTYLGRIVLDVVQGSTELTYDPVGKTFYVTDTNNELYTFAADDLNAEPNINGVPPELESAQAIGPIGGGLEIVGLDIVT